ncbi:hypothetical protein PLCT2_01687 [Planctomycetaceae bacterium]|nr:hypothetical protein PLCT2_01687 [Planctomycetaceae bacterium]
MPHELENSGSQGTEAHFGRLARTATLAIFFSALTPIVGELLFDWEALDVLFVYWAEMALIGVIYTIKANHAEAKRQGLNEAFDVVLCSFLLLPLWIFLLVPGYGSFFAVQNEEMSRSYGAHALKWGGWALAMLDRKPTLIVGVAIAWLAQIIELVNVYFRMGHWRTWTWQLSLAIPLYRVCSLFFITMLFPMVLGISLSWLTSNRKHFIDDRTWLVAVIIGKLMLDLAWLRWDLRKIREARAEARPARNEPIVDEPGKF